MSTTFIPWEDIAYIEKHMRKVWFRSVLRLSPSTATMVVVAMQYALCFHNMYVYVAREQTMPEEILETVGHGPDHHGWERHIARREYLLWSILDRSVTVVTVGVLAVGNLTSHGLLFMPYIAWVPVQVWMN